MTNAQIILNESINLMDSGIIKATDKFITVENEKGERKEIPMPEPIHTFQAWKSLGYQVQKGQKAKASFKIWKYKNQNNNANDEEEQQENGRMFLTKAFFFTFEQVAPINK